MEDKEYQNEELKEAQEEYRRIIAEVKMHQAMVKAAVDTLQKSKAAMADLAIKLEASQKRILALEGKEEEENGGQEGKQGEERKERREGTGDAGAEKEL